MPTHPPTALCLRAPEDVALGVPYLLGFHPRRSLVLAAVAATGEVTFTMRIDLPPLDAVPEVARMCAARLSYAGASAVIAAVFDDHGPQPYDGPPPHGARPPLDGPPLDGLPYAELAEELQRRLPMPMLDALLVAGDRVWSYLCPDPQCCPPAGRVVDRDSRLASALEAEELLRARPVLPDRASVLASALPVRGAAAESVREAFGRLAERYEPYDAAPEPLALEGLRLLRDVLGRSVDRPVELTADEAALLGAAWHHIGLRDDVLTEACQGAPGVADVVRAVARLVPSPYDAPVATMLAFVAYAEGSGCLADAAICRALATDPEYGLAKLLREAIERQVPPSVLRRVWNRLPDNDRRRGSPTPGA